MKIELRWVIVWMAFEFFMLTSFLGLLIYNSPIWLLSFIPMIVSLTYCYAVEKTINKNLKKG